MAAAEGTEIAFWKDMFPALVTFNVFLNGKPLENLTTFKVDSTGNAVLDSNGFPTLIKNSQITRPVDAPSKSAPPSVFGPTAGVTSVLEFIPSVPAVDDPVPVEPPVTFCAWRSTSSRQTHRRFLLPSRRPYLRPWPPPMFKISKISVVVAPQS